MPGELAEGFAAALGVFWLNVCKSFSGLYWKVKNTFVAEMFASLAFGASRIRVPLFMLGWLGKCVHPTRHFMFLWVQLRQGLFPSLHAQ